VIQELTCGVVQNQPPASHQVTEEGYASYISRSVAKGLEATIVATQLMTAYLISDVTFQAFSQTIPRAPGRLGMLALLLLYPNCLIPIAGVGSFDGSWATTLTFKAHDPR
jgi:hypothetical protein